MLHECCIWPRLLDNVNERGSSEQAAIKAASSETWKTVPYWHEIILHNYIISAPAGCNLIHWRRGLIRKAP